MTAAGSSDSPIKSGSPWIGPTLERRHLAPVKVGWVVLKSDSAAASSIGASSLATPDQTPYAQTMVDWVNAHGGLGGRQIRPVYYHMDPSGSQTNEQYGAAICATFTQDNHVDVAIDTTLGAASSTLVNCLDKQHIPFIDTTGTLGLSSTQVAKYKLFLPVSSVAVDTLAALEVSALAARGFYTKGSTVGVITYDTPSFHEAVERVFKPQLKAQTGLDVQDANITYLAPYASFADTGSTSAAVSNAVLKYQAHSVDHVIFLQNFSLAAVVFMTDADNQHYYPRYGLSSNDTPQADTALAPASQLRNSVGFGWRPSYDVTADQQVEPGRPACLQIFKATRLTFSAGDASEAAALRHCEAALVLKGGTDASKGALGAALIRAVETSLGAYRAATVLGIHPTAEHHDGVSAYRDLSYGSSCNCFHYTGPSRSIR